LHRKGTTHDFDGTMAVFDAIDLLISVDTGVVHLAGAMERPAWVRVIA
jgi:ADP-heptose:LPS heptosyltransferase